MRSCLFCAAPVRKVMAIPTINNVDFSHSNTQENYYIFDRTKSLPLLKKNLISSIDTVISVGTCVTEHFRLYVLYAKKKAFSKLLTIQRRSTTGS